MNLKHKAVLHTAGLVATMVGASILVSYVASLMTVAQVVFLLCGLCIAAMIYTIYSLILARLEYHKTLDDMAKKPNET
jgi:mannitol-specific phosphotransferase system IIBC component